jgi:hypothetical protein
MAFVNHPVEEPEKSLRDYTSPQCEDLRVQESDSKLEATKYEIKPKIIEMAAANPFEGMVMENPYRHIRHFTTLCNTVHQEGVLKKLEEEHIKSRTTPSIDFAESK